MIVPHSTRTLVRLSDHPHRSRWGCPEPDGPESQSPARGQTHRRGCQGICRRHPRLVRQDSFRPAQCHQRRQPESRGAGNRLGHRGAGANKAEVVPSDGKRLPLIQVGDTHIFAATTSFAHGSALRWSYVIDGSLVKSRGSVETYTDQPELTAREGAPKGKLTKQEPWKSQIYPGTTRDWWVYVPAQYKNDQPACVMVFQDGSGYTSFVPTVFDNLIAKGEMPVTVAIFLNPGSGNGERSREYDTLSDRYARFLLEEILPEVEKTVKLRHDPESRAIAGISSGGICAWTVAWERPDEFRKVLSWVGSFTNIASGKTRREGGHNYEALIRKSAKKPIRIFLQDGANDLDNANGNWPLANQQMAKALAFKEYDYHFVLGVRLTISYRI